MADTRAYSIACKEMPLQSYIGHQLLQDRYGRLQPPIDDNVFSIGKPDQDVLILSYFSTMWLQRSNMVDEESSKAQVVENLPAKRLKR